MVPERSPPLLPLLPPLSSSPPHAAAPSASTPQAAMDRKIFFMGGTLAARMGQPVIWLWSPCKKNVKTGLYSEESRYPNPKCVDVGASGQGLVKLLAQAGDVDVHGA